MYINLRKRKNFMKNISQVHMNINLTKAQRKLLQHIVNASTSSKSVSLRASIILLLAEGSSKYKLVKNLKVSWPTVNKWESRWLEAIPILNEIENNKSTHELKEAIIANLKDAPRSGAPSTFTEEEVMQIVALACTSPESEGLPISQWSCRSLAEHVQRQGIVESISYKQINNFLKSRGIKTA